MRTQVCANQCILRKKVALLGLDDIRLYEQPMQEFAFSDHECDDLIEAVR